MKKKYLGKCCGLSHHSIFKMLVTLKLTAFMVLFSAMVAFAQQVSVSGKITDSSGQPLPGVTVLLKGTTTQGTVSNVDGNYTLPNVPSNGTLQYSFIGMKAQEIAIGGRMVINLSMEQDAIGLDEVVAIGYGVQRKSNVTGSIASVRATDMENRTVTDAAQALQGKAAGVQITNTTGAPGSTSSIQIRGYSSNSRTEPLIIVDGLKVQNLNYLDPENVESIEILKDGASAAIYGIEAGNGVILVTTKRGTSTAGRGRIFYNMQNTSQKIANLPRLLNAQEYMDYLIIAGAAGSMNVFDYDGHTDTDWVKEMTETGKLTRHTIGFEGGNDRGSTYVSLASIKNDGIIVGDRDIYDRITGQINADYKINDWLTVGVNSSLERTTSRNISEGTQGGMSGIGQILIADPTTPVAYAPGTEPARVQTWINQGFLLPKDKNGWYLGSPAIGTSNPAVNLVRSDPDTKSFNVRGTGYINLTPIKGLTVTSRFGYRAGYTTTSTYNYEMYVNSTSQSTMSLTGRSSTNLYYQWENFGNYLFTLGDHDFSTMIGMSYQYSESNYINANIYSLSANSPEFRYFEYSLNTSNMQVRGLPSESSNLSYYGRLGWSYDSRFDIQGSFRADAYDTSKLDKSNRWGYFPSISGGWTIGNEAFMDNIKSKLQMSHLRLRASYGVNGNVNSLGQYQYNKTLGIGLGNTATGNSSGNNPGGGYDWGSGQKLGVYPSTRLANPSIKWETTRQLNVGFDARFLRDRLTLGVEAYNKNTFDLLTSNTAPASTGSSTVYVNAGTVNNKGIDIELGWRDRIGDFSYSFNGNIAFLKNKVTKGITKERVEGSGLMYADIVTFFEEGYPIWYLRTYIMEGIDPATGDAIYTDVDGNGVLNADDHLYAGKGIPDYTYGLTLNLAYKNFDLTVYGSGVQGVQKMFALGRGDNQWSNTLYEYYKNMWTPTNTTNAKYPRPNQNDIPYRSSSALVFDASFFKIKQVQIGYNVPASITKKVNISRLRAYVSLDDWFTFTKYPGLDPETNSGASTMSQLPLDYGNYPISKKVVLGINVSF